MDKNIEYSDEVLNAISKKVVKGFLEDATEMNKYALLEVLDALNNGEDVHADLISKVFTKSFMDKFIDELLKYEEE